MPRVNPGLYDRTAPRRGDSVTIDFAFERGYYQPTDSNLHAFDDVFPKGPMDRRMDELLQIAQIVPDTEAEGPGRRFALWFQGCPLRCPGCCNPEMLPFSGGTARPLGDVLAMMTAAARSGVEGITLLGGEPFSHAAHALRLAVAAHGMNLSVMIFSGYRLENLRASPDAVVRRLLEHVDLLVDGPYLRELPERTRRWIGSSNQRVHFLGPRCSADDPRWLAPNTLELRLEDGQVTINGFPARKAVGLWKRKTEARA